MRSPALTSIVLVAAALLGRGRAHARDLGDLLVERGVISARDLEELRKEAAAEPSPYPTATPVERRPTPIATPEVRSAAAEAAPAASPSLDALVKTEVAHQLPDWMKTFKLSTLIYMDWAYYLDTGYGPQFLTQITPPGPGNDGFNSFDLTRAYINLFWKPSDRFQIRITPNVFREIDTNAAANTSKSSQVATNVNGNLTYRLKYGWLQANDILRDFHAGLPEIDFRVGQLENPLVPWEEDLYGYRFVNLVPLNYLAYSSTDLGLAFFGPVRIGGTRYADYWLGVYNGSSFHSAEFNEKRSPQGRLSVYPLAASPGFENLGVTYFMSYGYTNVAPDTSDRVIRRMAGLVHYSAKYGGVAFEWDRTRNQNNFNNFFSGAAPTQTIADPTDPEGTIPNPIAVLYGHILNASAIGQGFSLFGHVNLGNSPFSVFGMWQRWFPNLDVDNDPLDFDRWIVGAAWQAQSWLRLAVDSQNIMYVHGGPAVPDDTHAIFTNLEINY